MPRINLLPWREQQRVDRKKAFGVGLGAAGLAAAVVTGAGYLLFGQMVEAQQARNTLLRNEIKVLDKQIEQINSLEQQKKQFVDRMQIIEKLQQSRSEIVHIFDAFVKTIPDGPYLTSIVQTAQKFEIQGVAQSAGRVTNFWRALDATQWLQDSELKGIENSTKFTLYAKQRAVAEEPAPATKGADKRKKP